MLWSAGCTVIEGATGLLGTPGPLGTPGLLGTPGPLGMPRPLGAVTVSFALRLVALPAELLTTTAKVTPLSAVVSAGGGELGGGATANGRAVLAPLVGEWRGAGGGHGVARRLSRLDALVGGLRRDRRRDCRGRVGLRQHVRADLTARAKACEKQQPENAGATRTH